MSRTLLLLSSLKLLVLAAALAALAPLPDRAQAQGNDSCDVGERCVDLWVEMERQEGTSNRYAFTLRVGNAGNHIASDVVVKLGGSNAGFWPVNVPEGTWLEDALGNRITSVDYGSRFLWKIPQLEGQEQYEILLSLARAQVASRVAWYDASVTSATAETATRQHNNRHRFWRFWDHVKLPYTPETAYGVEVGVADRSPAAGDTVNFTVKVKNTDRFEDGCVNIRLTGGLTPPEPSTPTFTRKVREDSLETSATGHSFATSTTRECGDKSGGARFYLLPAQTADYESTMTLPVTVKNEDGIVVSEQCLTAEIFAIPPAGGRVNLDDGSDNRAQGCLRPAPPQVFDDGEVAAWALHACKESVAQNGCVSAADVQVKVFAYAKEDDDHGHGHSTSYHPYPNHTALIHVKDAPGRVFDAPGATNNKSITGATTVSWQTATALSTDFTGTRAGPAVGLYRTPVNAYIDNWASYHPTFRLSGLRGAPPPGSIGIRVAFNGNRFWDVLSSSNKSAKLASPFPLDNTSDALTALFIEFDQLGTYVVDYDVDMLHATIDDDNDGTKDTFSGTGRTFFHVGPIADLGVQDGGASPDATTDQVAFSVVANNHRNEVAPLGKVVVDLPAGARGLRTVPPNTGVFHPNLDPPKWTWDVGDLERGDNLDWKGGWADGQPVTLIVDRVPVGATATATVSYDPYEVCIASDGANAKDDKGVEATTEAACDKITGAMWRTGTVYDVDDQNDTATLTARRGLNGAASGDGVPTTSGAGAGAKTQTRTTTTVTWDEVKYLYGYPVTGYQVQGLVSSEWVMLDDAVAENEYVEIGAGRSAYRVRAVNLAGVTGPWSGPMWVAGSPPPSPGTPPPGVPTPTLGAPSFAAPGVAVTLYAGQWGVAALPLASGGVGNITYSFSPALGNGLYYSPADHLISSQSSTTAAATTAYTLTATDSATPTANTATVTVNVTVIPDVCSGTASSWRPVGYDEYAALTFKERAALIQDCNLLLSAKSALEGSGGTKTLNWSTAVPIDTWDYLRYQTDSSRSGYRRIDTLVDTSTSTTKLRLGGVIPPQLDGLSALERVVLPDHGLSGAVPGLVGLINMTEVDLSGNSLSGSLPAFHGLTGLVKLNLSGNGLTGSIPASLGNLANLERLDLSDNALSGSIPHQLGNAVKLEYLWLNDNALTGGIPMKVTGAFARPGLDSLAVLRLHDGLRLYGNQLETTIVLAATPTSALTEGGAARDTTATVTIDAGTAWASRFEVLNTSLESCNVPEPASSCYLATRSWDGKVTATVGATTTDVPVTVSPGEINLTIPEHARVPTFNSYVFTITPGTDAANTNTPGSVTISVTGKGAPGVADTAAKVTPVVVTVNDDGQTPPQTQIQTLTPSVPDFDNQVVELHHVADDSTGCLDVPGGWPDDGKEIQTWECNDTPAQQWRLVKRISGDKAGEYSVVSQAGDKTYCLDNRGDFTTSDRMGVWTCVADTHWAVDNQSVTIAASGAGYTLTFSNNGSSVWMTTDRASNDPKGGAGQTTVTGTVPTSAVWRIVID